MTDKELKAKISLLNNIKPKQDWVVLTKSNILGETPAFKPYTQPFSVFSDIVSTFKLATARPALIVPALALIVAGGVMLQVASTSLPGDTLYPVKVALSKAKVTLLASDETKAIAHLGLAQNNLNDLKRAVEENKTKNLASAIQVFEDNIAIASKEIQELVENQSSGALQATIEIVQLQKDKAVVEKILGTVIGNENGELESAIKLLVENELSDLQQRSLTEEQEALLAEALASYEIGEYGTALESIWRVSNN
ncbi:MAG: DUF5667 domain-containing protein [Patescibacteria group bacterium]|nr:DUF5667 domain-containing protein [Patescibacteria group bacterium]